MNEFLAAMYDTRESIGASQDPSDVEKLAEAQLLDEYLQAEGVDIDQLPGDTILKLAQDLIGEDSAIVKAAQQEQEAEDDEGEEDDESFETKLAEADFLGRAMAHSFWQEKTAIEKDAGIRDLPGRAWGVAKGYAGKAGEGAKGLGSKAKSWATKPGRDYKHIREHGAVNAKGERPGRWAALKGSAKKNKAQVGAAAALGTAGAAGSTYAATRGKKKESSALDMLAEKRAMEWAAEHGLLEDQSSYEEKLGSAVDQRAYEMLQAAGIDVDAIEAAQE